LDAQTLGDDAAVAEHRAWLEREIVQRRRAEEALRESENRLQLAVRSARLTLCALDRALRYTWVFNPPAGVDANALIGRTDEEIFGAEGRALSDLKRKAIEQRAPTQAEVGITIGGIPRHFDVSVDPLHNPQGDVIGVCCAAFEITRLKKAERALQDSEARYRAIVEAFDGLIYICTPDLNVEYMNAPLIERTGRCAIGEKCFKALHGFDAPCPWCRADRVFSGEKAQWEFRSPLDNRWYYAINMPIRRADGSIAKLAAIMDITDRKTLELQRAEMEKSFLRAQHLESLARLTGQIAHHFNNQLTVIMGSAELGIDESYGNRKLERYLHDIRAAAERAARLTNELLTISGNAFTQMESVSLNDLIGSCHSLLDVSGAPYARIRYTLSGAAPTLKIDARLLRQALLNLVTNAIEAIGDRPGEIEIATGIECVEQPKLGKLLPLVDRSPGDFAFLRVSDTGGGIRPEIEARLFDPFTSTKGVGRGLGLAVALGIASAHLGGLLIESEPGRGCTATIYLPLPKG
jgi:signal transduction histidine kinase